MLILAALASLTAAAAKPASAAERGTADERSISTDLTAGITAMRSGTSRDASGTTPRDVELHRTVPGGVLAFGAEDPKGRGVEIFAAVTGLFRESIVNEPPVFGNHTPRPTRAALGVGPRGHLRAGIDGAFGPRGIDLYGSVGPVMAIGVSVPEPWQPAWPPHLRLGVHASVAVSTPIGSGVQLHTGWRSLLLAEVTGDLLRRRDPWHLGLFTVGVQVPLQPDRVSPGPSPSPR